MASLDYRYNVEGQQQVLFHQEILGIVFLECLMCCSNGIKSWFFIYLKLQQMYMGNVAHFLCKCSFWCDNSLKSCLLFWANCVPATRISCSDLFSLAKLWWLYIANKIFSPMSSQTTIFGFIPSDFQSSDASDLVGTNRWMQVPCNHGNKTCIPYLTKIK